VSRYTPLVGSLSANTAYWTSSKMMVTYAVCEVQNPAGVYVLLSFFHKGRPLVTLNTPEGGATSMCSTPPYRRSKAHTPPRFGLVILKQTGQHLVGSRTTRSQLVSKRRGPSRVLGKKEAGSWHVVLCSFCVGDGDQRSPSLSSTIILEKDDRVHCRLCPGWRILLKVRVYSNGRTSALPSGHRAS